MRISDWSSDVCSSDLLVGSYNSRLRKREIPFLGALDASTVSAIEKRTFAASYKGVTDVVTKYVWPWPARHVTRFCARFGISPNQVTLVSQIGRASCRERVCQYV